MKIKALLIIYLTLLLSAFEAASSIENIDKYLQKVEVRSAVIFNKNGEPVCRVDLLNYPDLIPNFAKLSTDKTAYQARSFQKELDSGLQQGIDLQPCADKYLVRLKEVATSNVVVNSETSHIHKTGWGRAAGVAAACATGIGVSMKTDIDSKKKITGASIIEIFSIVAALSTNDEMTQATEELKRTKKGPWINPNEQRILKNKISKSKKSKTISLAIAIGSICYLIPEMSIILYENYIGNIESFIQELRTQEYEHFYNFKRNKKQ